LKFAQVPLGLVLTPTVVGVVPDLLRVCLRGRREKVPAAHRRRGARARLRSRKALKSNGVEVPLDFAVLE
jgi:hypothetical protein